MFDRSLLKANAKQSLSRFYGMSLVALLIVYGILYTATSIITSITTFAAMGGLFAETMSASSMSEEELTALTMNAYFIIYGVVLASSLLLCFFGGFHFQIGQNRFYLNARENPYNLGDLFFAFKNNYWKNAWTMFTMYLYIFLWSLLFLIPGYIKMFEYSMIPYLLAENPNMSRKRAFELSKAMTKGYKGDLFILGLSFIGWYLLGILATLLTCGVGAIGIYFLYPYIYATFAEAYTFLKARALENGLAAAEDFPGFSAALPTAPAAEAPAITE